MTDQYTNLLKLLRELTKNCNSYYIKHPTTLSKETLNGNTVYSKYQKYNGKVTDTLLKQHINNEIDLAISIKDLKNVLVYNYKGKELYAFKNILIELAKSENIKNIIVLDYGVNSLSIYIDTPNESNIKILRNKINSIIENKLPKEWITLPNNKKPHLSNLIYLPRELFIE